ncbi:MAG: alpha/beta hydrolase [Saprospiraceae bacterium]|nr:alpha/beta hydrolase [Saprospiraceae bacterium]
MNAIPSTKRVEILETSHIDKTSESITGNPPVLKLIQLGFQVFGPLFPKYAGKLAFQLFTTPRVRAHHKASDEILESARMFEFLYGKQILKGYEWGSGDRTILLVHGWESRGTALRTFVPGLIKQGFRVVAFDGPAHGNSGGKRTNLVHFAGAIQAAIRQVGNVHSIIAHSFGGASTVFALSNSSKTIALEKLVLIATPSSMRKVMQKNVDELKLPKSVTTELFKYTENLFQRPVDTVDVRHVHEKLAVKETLLVHDRLDPMVPFQSSEAVLDAWENTTLLVTEGFGHYRLMKNPDLIVRVTQFIISPVI